MPTLGTPVDFEVTGTTINQAVDAGAGADRVLYVAVFKTTAGTVDTITYNAVTMAAVSGALGAQSNDSIQWYRLIAPASGSNTLNIVVGSGGGYIRAYVLPYSGIDQAAPDSNGAGSNGTGSPVTLAVTSASGKTVVDGFGLRHTAGGSSATVGGGQTAHLLASGNADGGAKSAGASSEAGANSVTMSWTATNAGNWVQAGFSLNDAGGGGGGTALQESEWQPTEPQTNPLTVTVW